MVIGTIDAVQPGGAQARLCRASIEALRNDSGDATLALAGTVGSQIKIAANGCWLFGSIRQTMRDPACPDTIIADIDLIGECESAFGQNRDFRRGITTYPRTGDAVDAVTHADLAAVFGSEDRRRISIGTVHATRDIAAQLFFDPLLSRHFALVGSSGSGKSSATALILHRIIEQAPLAHVVIIDPHGEYARAFADKGRVFNVDNLDMPYWMMNFEEHCEVFVMAEGVEGEMDRAILAQCLLVARSKSVIAGRFPDLTVDSPIPYMMFELLGALQSHMGKLDNGSEVARYVRLKNRIETILRDTRYGFMFRRELCVDNMRGFLAQLLRMPGDGRPVSVLDLSGVPSDIVSVVVALLSRIVMDYAIWARTEPQRPILLVCEEAHRYVPASSGANGAAVRKLLERIAKEGRKYGVSLALVTQRPSDLAEGALSQCGTIIAMRLNNERDQACVRNAMPEGGRGLLDAIPALRRGECVICGEGVAIPMRVHVDLLAEQLRPRSDDLLFSAQWADVHHDPALLDRVILRWRRQSETAEFTPVTSENGASLLLRKA
jgi:DNA helicase HerA-like ATPase